MRSTDFPFAVMPQRLSVRRFQEGGRADYRVQDTTDYLRSLKSPTGIVGRDTLAALPVSVRDRIRDKLAVVIGRDNADKAMLPVEMLLDPILAGNEARLAADKGNYGEAALGAALAALPIPVPAKKSIKASADAAKSAMKKGAKKTDAPALAVKPDVVEPLAARPRIAIRTKPSGIIAYHGSPHTFHRFDMSKIGTGEGNQSYGHGLYFAENEGVAQSYRDALTKGAMDSLEFKKIGLSPNDRRDAMMFARTTHNLFPEIAARDFANYLGKEFTPDLVEAYSKTKDIPKGSMYQVRIDADPNDFLSWDAPAWDQPAAIQEMITRKGWRTNPPEAKIRQTASGKFTALNRWGETIGTYKTEEIAREKSLGSMADLAAKPAGPDVLRAAGNKGIADPEASQALRELGIPGIKYLDQGSRIVGDGSRNFVVFDDELVNILKRYRDGGLAVKKKKKPRVSKRKAFPQSSPNSSM
jgi:hypothetical protein